MPTQPKLTRFNQNVLSKYQIYNSIFMTLPFDSITKTGVLLPLFHETCKKGFQDGDNPTTIVETFFKKYQARRSKESQTNLLFRFIQYIERQVVLFDAIEDAAFPIVNNMDGVGTLRSLTESASSENKLQELQQYLKEFKVRIVLTAHPTQFYPGSVLGIITDLTAAIKANDLLTINDLLAQLGKTPFFKHEKPTPYDEAVSLIWYLEHVFYFSFGSIYDYIQQNIFEGQHIDNDIINIGFWPGGDRDGNPYVTPETTLKVAARLRESILKNYYRDIRRLKRKLTFKGVEERLSALETGLYDAFVFPGKESITLEHFVMELGAIKATIIKDHQSLYLEQINSLLNKTRLFGFHFGALDIRQDSRAHAAVFNTVVDKVIASGSEVFPKDYQTLSEAEQIKTLSAIKGTIDISLFEDEMVLKTLNSMKAIKTIQQENGEKAANRYIISNNQSTLHVMQLFAMLKIVAFEDDLTVDIGPLFETIVDLENAPAVMEELYTNSHYAAHLKKRGNKQTIMLGFSDGTKDGGYLMANWGIFKAKERLTAVSRKYDVTVIFFDGRGGPPARGGGKTHQFYASLGPTIEDKEVQLTIQGQTISSNFGTMDSSQYNLEQLISSGILNRLNDTNTAMSKENTEVMEDLAQLSYKTYSDFKSHKMFVPYLERMSTLKYYAKTNIGSRPSKRGNSDKLVFEDLRAIPFVGSWSQLKQNVPGFFGVGTALKHYEDNDEFEKVKHLYESSNFFKTLVENSMMSLSKSFFDLTKYMADDEEFGDFWNIIHNEYETSKRLLLKLTDAEVLMQEEPTGKASIDVRESIVLPLLTIQQYALKKIQELERAEVRDQEQIDIYEKIVTRSLFGNINASRNSA
ncbi:phosphoenolpyruvate carboxylase [Subsaximicrobium wynnwilliamsii]|uniref:Phosphoenolpyruvate carboxylase n=1 Tax=Subsaximicrobium wynnwilliamsii TaxID=291179 RepID=A0A5C6ZE75_9FLAO|nr:phosphoenolpyruvate carboxylase [Subsaximicrobium wynnwilliamsii]TXD82213.1 phosphoenolpyruvate carboxylase [Subsaximicrobium wynnwilliamsii]TXD87853.1 phosphoenolpyruvate carboxylase [Subsaximicrobium wynnwilliamsii]TXE01803.1 phosphoenolpyruvate carboxylase [Subsaximicrobium wynnwilliamsii]